MNSTGRYADLRTHAEFATIRELGRRIVQEYCAIYASEETRSSLVVSGNNTLGVAGSVNSYVIHRLRNVSNNPD